MARFSRPLYERAAKLYSMARLGTILFILLTILSIVPSEQANAIINNPLETKDGKHFFHSIYPNPASSEVVFSIELSSREPVEIEIYNQIGKKVDIIHEKIYEFGDCRIIFDVSEYNKGLYFVHVKIGNERYIRKFSVLR